MKHEDYLNVNIEIQTLLRSLFPEFETGEKSSVKVTDFFQRLSLTNEVVKKIKIISRYKFETEDEEKLSGFMHCFISSSLEKILQHLIINDEISLFLGMYFYFSRAFIYDGDNCYQHELETLAVSNSNSKCIIKNNNLNKRDLIFIKFYTNQYFYAMVDYLSNLQSRLNNRESWTVDDIRYKRIHEGVHSSKYNLLSYVVYRNIEWLKHCTRIGIVNCNDRFRPHGAPFGENLKLNFLIYDIPLRLDYYSEIISKEFQPNEAEILCSILNIKALEDLYDADKLRDKYNYSSFYQFLSKRGLIKFQSANLLTKKTLYEYFILYLLEKGFSPFYFNAAGVLAESCSQLECYEHLIASGFDIFETNHFGFNLISLFIRYQGNSATLTIVNLLKYCSAFPEILNRIFQQGITIFPLDFSYEEYEGCISSNSYPEAMLNRDEEFRNGVPYSTLLDIALMHCHTDMIHFLIMLRLKLGNTTRQKLHDNINFLKDIACSDEEKNGVDQNFSEHKSLLTESETSGKKILNLPFMYEYLTKNKCFQHHNIKTLFAFVFLTKLPILNEQEKKDLASKLSNFDADGAFDIFSGFLVARNKEISIETGQKVFEDTPYQLPIEIIDIIVNQMLSHDYWYLPFVIVKIANDFLFTKQQNSGSLQGPAA